jgi:class 3 adenylate cyclase
VQAESAVTTFLFTDIEGSTRLWEEEPERMRPALARHDALVRAAVESNRGTVVKMIGDGVHAAFDDPLAALNATLAIQCALVDPNTTNGVALRVRCGLHVGVVERRDNDYFGSPVNRAARIMDAAHGGQVLLSQAVVDCVCKHLPSASSLRDLGRVRLKDLAMPEHVYQLVHPQLRQDFPALRSLEATPNNLPQQISSFIGREHELSEVKRLLTQSGLLTLVGIGGIGKTRLSLQWPRTPSMPIRTAFGWWSSVQLLIRRWCRQLSRRCFESRSRHARRSRTRFVPTSGRVACSW